MDLTLPLGCKACYGFHPPLGCKACYGFHPPLGRVARNERGGPFLSAPSIAYHSALTDEFPIPLPASSFLLSDPP
jgi:hypothetical protein